MSLTPAQSLAWVFYRQNLANYEYILRYVQVGRIRDDPERGVGSRVDVVSEVVRRFIGRRINDATEAVLSKQSD